ncbi:MAG TPA: extracellular solute-binding protein, partial [Chloroflexota bacterium]
MSGRVSRRRFVRTTLPGGVALLLAACAAPNAATTSGSTGITPPASSPSGSTSTTVPSTPASAARSSAGPSTTSAAQPTAGAARTATLPSYLPLQPVTADFPADVDGLEAGYNTYPKDPPASITGTPGKGSDVEVMVWNPGPALTSPDQNALWKALNTRIGANLKLNAVAVPDYQSKLATVMASGSLPDILYIPNGSPIDHLLDFAHSSCTDLTPFVAGDAIKNYPNLANIPTRSWRAGLLGSRTYGLPVPSAPFQWALWVHQDLMDQVGATQPATGDDFKHLLQQLTQPTNNVYGIVMESTNAFGVTAGLYPAIFGAPNNWRLDPSGQLTRSYETPEYRAAIAYAQDLYAAGVYAPDTLTSTNATGRAAFSSRKVAVRWDGYDGAGAIQFLNMARTLTPPSTLRRIRPFAHDGSAPTYYLANGNFGFHLFKKASPDRINELLGILNFFAAPFGTQEYLMTHYGLPDVHYTPDASGNPTLTQQGQADVSPVWQYIASPASVLYYPQAPDFVPVAQADERAWLAAGVDDPTLGVYSNTASAHGPGLDQGFNDGVADIVAGRRPPGDLDQL